MSRLAAWAASVGLLCGRRFAQAAAAVDTIFALGTPPGRSALAVVRASGPAAHSGVALLLSRGTASLPPPNCARPVRLRTPGGAALDDALLLLFRAPASATGEDVAELHVHGSGAVVRGVLAALAALPGWRPATAGEFSRRAFHAGKLDLAQAEGLADLLRAETDTERCAALAQARGALSRQAAAWRSEALLCLAHAEAGIDFGEEASLGDGLASALRLRCAALAAQL
jgi:tRNA modification GTPase